MGVRENITINTFPKQGKFLNKKVNVCFHYDTTNMISGYIVRDDAEAPHILLILLEDGRYVLGTECQFSLT